MGKSLRSKVKRKFRAIKREKRDPELTEQDRTRIAAYPDVIRPAGVDFKPLDAPLDPRVKTAAWALAFPEKVTEADAAQRALEVRTQTRDTSAPEGMDDEGSEEAERMDDGTRKNWSAKKSIEKKRKANKKKKGRKAGSFW